MDRAFRGVWIPKEVWVSKELSLMEKALLVEIDSLDNENHCYASNAHFAEFLDCSIPTVSRGIKKLEDRKLIIVHRKKTKDGTERWIESAMGATDQNDEWPHSSKRSEPTNQNDERINTEESNTGILSLEPTAPAPLAPLPKPPTRVVTDAFQDQFLKACGHRPTWGAKEGQMIKRLLVAHTPEEIVQATEKYFAMDWWFAKNGERQFGAFATHFDEILSSKVKGGSKNKLTTEESAWLNKVAFG